MENIPSSYEHFWLIRHSEEYRQYLRMLDQELERETPSWREPLQTTCMCDMLKEKVDLLQDMVYSLKVAPPQKPLPTKTRDTYVIK